MSADRKNFVQNYYNKLYSQDYADAISNYLSDDYIEHQFKTGFTKAGLRDYVSNRLSKNPNHRVIIHHVIAQDEMVFLFVEEKLENELIIARAELFRLAEDKIAEHWGSHVIDEKNRKNSNGTFDGEKVNTDVDYAAKYFDQFQALDNRGFDGQEIDCFYESRTKEYKQHSPKGGDGVDGLVEILRFIKDNGMKMIMQPRRAIVEGDIIVSHRLYNTDPPHPLVNRINTFDMFRINAQGKATEHWDVMEDIPSDDLLEHVL